jgi:hypothetical protein
MMKAVPPGTIIGYDALSAEESVTKTNLPPDSPTDFS